MALHPCPACGHGEYEGLLDRTHVIWATFSSDGSVGDLDDEPTPATYTVHGIHCRKCNRAADVTAVDYDGFPMLVWMDNKDAAAVP